MRQKARNVYFTFFYPGRMPGADIVDTAPCVAVPDKGEWVSISGPKRYGEHPSAVFYEPDELRALADVLYEAADLLEENRSRK